LAKTSSSSATSSSAVIAGRRVSRYFEEDRLARTESAWEASSARAGRSTPSMVSAVARSSW
jgi:hypothetical protein